MKKKARQPSASSSKTQVPASRRYSGVPMGTPSKFHISSLPLGREGIAHPRATTTMSFRSVTPKTERPAVKPKWNSSTNMRDTVVGHNFKPLTLTTPSPFRRPSETPGSLRSMSSQSSIPVRSPLGRTAAISPSPGSRPSSTRRPLASPMQSPSTPAKGKTPMRSTPGSASSAVRRQVIAEEDYDSNAIEDSPVARRVARPPSAANNRRSSLLPTPKQRTSSSSSVTPGRSSSRMGDIDEGRSSKLGGRNSRVGGRQSSLGERPSWK